MTGLKLNQRGGHYRWVRRLRNLALNTSKRLQAVDSTSYIHRSARVPRDLETAEYAFVGPGCVLSPMTSIGRYSMLAANVSIVGGDHTIDRVGVPMQFAGRLPATRTRIGSDVWLGRASTVMRGLTIGHGAVVAAGAVVTKDIPPYEIWAGVPARRIGERFPCAADRARHQRMLDGATVSPEFAEPLALNTLPLGKSS